MSTGARFIHYGWNSKILLLHYKGVSDILFIKVGCCGISKGDVLLLLAAAEGGTEIFRGKEV